jgi:hypothetical protein
VTAGLKKIEASAKDVAERVATDNAKAKEAAEQIEPLWQKIEGTIKANDKDTYLAFEDNFALLETAAKEGDVTKAQRASAGVSKAITDYVRKYPG